MTLRPLRSGCLVRRCRQASDGGHTCVQVYTGMATIRCLAALSEQAARYVLPIPLRTAAALCSLPFTWGQAGPNLSLLPLLGTSSYGNRWGG